MGFLTFIRGAGSIFDWMPAPMRTPDVVRDLRNRLSMSIEEIWQDDLNRAFGEGSYLATNGYTKPGRTAKPQPRASKSRHRRR
jgi:hypothetical protein